MDSKNLTSYLFLSKPSLGDLPLLRLLDQLREEPICKHILTPIVPFRRLVFILRGAVFILKMKQRIFEVFLHPPFVLEEFYC